MKKKIFLLLILFTFISLLFFIFHLELKNETVEEVTKYQLSNEAESMIVMDMRTKRVLNSYQANKKMLPASITKILTCITCIEHYDLDHIIVVGEEVLKSDGSSIYLKIGDIITVRDLLYGLMLCSGNDAAIVLAYHYNQNIDDFIYLMNQTAKQIGMNDSNFENPSGLNGDTRNITTAYDMALLMSYAMKNETFRKITSTKDYKANLFSNRTMYFHNKHRLLQESEDVIGGKTGYTKEAHRTLVTCFKKDEFEIVVVTLNCSSDWSFHEKLSQKAFEDYDLKQVISKLDLFFSTLTIGKIEVQREDLLVPTKNGEKLDVKLLYDDKYVQIMYYEQDNLIASVLLRRKNE